MVDAADHIHKDKEAGAFNISVLMVQTREDKTAAEEPYTDWEAFHKHTDHTFTERVGAYHKATTDGTTTTTTDDDGPYHDRRH